MYNIATMATTIAIGVWLTGCQLRFKLRALCGLATVRSDGVWLVCSQVQNSGYCIDIISNRGQSNAKPHQI